MEARIKHAVKRWLALILCLCMLIPTSGTVVSAAEASAETDVITEEPSQEYVETDSPSDKEGDEDAEENQSDGDLAEDDTAENDMTGDDMTGNENLENNKDEDKITSDDNAGEKTAGKKVVEKADSEVKASPKKNTDNVVSQSNDNSWLDGDYAYIDMLDFSSGNGYRDKSIMTGTEPWDSDDAKGNDTSASNGTVRSFDVVTYTVQMQNKVRVGSPHEHYKKGTFYYELILPADTDEARFELDSMGWVTSKPDAQHEYVYTDIYNGQTVQVLRGSFTWAPSETNSTAIGESWQTLGVAVRVLAMTQGETIQPLFTFWMDHNEVPSSGLVTGSNHECGQHDAVEYKTLTAPEITVTTAPRYNVALEQGWNTNYLGTFDFGSGNDQAQNKNAGTRNGRVQAFGVTLQVQGKPGQGLRGCEIPDASKPITFDLKLSSTYKKTDGDNVDASRVSNDGFAPLLWSAEGNKDSGTQQDDRAIAQGDKYAFLAAPFNSETGSPRKEYACKNGGTWAAVQNDGTVSVTVSDYEVDLNRIPNTVAKNAITDTKYYDPDVFESGYWNVQTACFSAGEFWVVQPFTSESGTQVVDEYGDGQFNLTVEDVNLHATGVSGNALANADDNSNQAITTDDRQSVTMALEQPGEIEQYINYSGTEITNACHDDGRDWSLKGAGIKITEQLAHLGAEGQNTGVAYDDLMKFDDAFFDIESAAVGDKR